MPKFLNTDLKSDSESDSYLGLENIVTKADNKLMIKLEKSVLILILNKTFYSYVFVCAYIFEGVIF